MLLIWTSLKLFGKELTFSQKDKFLGFSKQIEFADDNFKFDENGRKSSKQVENIVKRRNCSLRAISPFPTVFSKGLHCRQVKTRACLGKGLTHDTNNTFSSPGKELCQIIFL